MSGISFIYHSPTTPGNPGYSVDLTDLTLEQGVRLGDLGGLSTEAELGAVGSSTLRLDDPTGTAGHNNDAIIGLKQLSVNEGRAPSGNRRIGEFYITNRHYYRGTQGVSPSLLTGVERVIDMGLADINAFLSFRILRTGTANGSNTTFNRPAETDVQRITALLAVPFLADTLFDGLVSSLNPVNMDAVDYTGQTPADVLNDCAQQSGKNFFVFYDEAGTYTPSPGKYGLFYDSNDSLVYPAAVAATQVSNVLADISAGGAGPIWYPLQDASLVRDPSRVISGAFYGNGSNSRYQTLATTSYTYGWRDAVVNSPNLKTTAQIDARLNRYLSENATEDDRLTFTLKLPAAHVNDWKEGQYASVKFSHLPDYSLFRRVRCLTRSVAQNELTDQFYNVRYECTPMTPPIPGAFSVQVSGSAYSGIPVLKTPTIPGDVLLLVVMGRGATTQFPNDIRMQDNPNLSPGTPPIPPYPDHAGWTVLGTAVTDASGMNIGGPCGGFNPVPYCTLGIIVGIAWRYVQPGEVTTHPVAVSTTDEHDNTAAWLWELPPTAVPVLVGTLGSTHGANPDTWTLPSNAGNVLGAFAWWQASSGHENAAVTPHAGVNTVQFKLNDNHDVFEAFSGWDPPVSFVGQMPSGGAMAVGFSCLSPTYTSVNGCGVAVTLPSGIVLPGIPYPANQI